MARVLRSPAKYVQGERELLRIQEHMKDLGRKVFVIISDSGIKRVGSVIEQSFKDTDMELVFEIFHGECSKIEINRLVKQARGSHCDVVCGIGGGKILDVAKAVSYYLEVPVVIIPTVASTDAPCSALSVLYKEDGVFDQYLFLRESPNLVLVDESIIMLAPVRLLIAGMGDAMATYFEARAVENSGKNNQVGGRPTIAANTLAKACWNTILKDGLNAKLAFQNSCCTVAVKNIIEANTYLSGVGFESGGLAAAHAIQKGFTIIPELHDLYHGEKVAYGTLVQLVMENAPEEEIKEVVEFCIKVGLPVTLQQLGIEDISKERLYKISEYSARQGMTIHNMPFEVTADVVFAGLLGADAIGKKYSNY